MTAPVAQGPLAGWEQHQFCYLTTTGRVTGRPHTIEIWFVVHDGAAWLLTERSPETDWVRNLRRNAEVVLRVGDVEHRAVATVVDDLPADAEPRRMLAARYQESYGDEDLLGWAASALAVRVAPGGGDG